MPTGKKLGVRVAAVRRALGLGPWPAQAGDGQHWPGGSAWPHDRPGVGISPGAGASRRGVSPVWPF